VSIAAASSPSGLRRRSSALDVLRRGATPSTVGTPWRRPASSLFFLSCGGVESVLAQSASLLAGSASSALPRLLLPPDSSLVCAAAEPEVKSTPNPPSFFTAMMLGFHFAYGVHHYFV
jgi:hypothetical protein